MNVTLDAAYEEACAALGAAIVTQRLLSAEVERLAAENEQLRAQLGE